MKKWLLLFAVVFIYGCNNNSSPTGPANSPTPPAALFSTVADTFTVGETVQFTNKSENATSYKWDFGDGNSATTENVSYFYSSDGKFKVTLTASNGNTSDTYEKELVIAIFPGETVIFSPGGEHEFFFTSWTSFGPSGFDFVYSGSGKEYFSKTGISLISFFLVGNRYFSGARFSYKAAANTPKGSYQGKFTITFRKGSSKTTIEEDVLFIVK